MKYIIKENQYKRIQNKILQSIDENGFIQTVNSFKLTYDGFNKIFPNFDLSVFSCNELGKIVKFFYKKKWVKDKYEVKKNDVIFIEIDNFIGTVYFEREFDDESAISGYATPFYEGDCILPIDSDTYFLKKDNGFDENALDVIGKYGEQVDLSKKFKTLADLKNWLEFDYINELIKFTDFIKEDIENNNNNYY